MRNVKWLQRWLGIALVVLALLSVGMNIAGEDEAFDEGLLFCCGFPPPNCGEGDLPECCGFGDFPPCDE